MKKLKDVLSVIGVIALIIFLVYKCSSGGIGEQDILIRQERADCTVIYEGGGKFEIEYTINGIKYIIKRPRPYLGIQNGEKFKIAYNPENVKDALPLFYEPIIDIGKYDTTKTVDGLYWSHGNYYSNRRLITFYYKIRGKEYKKNQALPYTTEKEDINLKSNYKVVYRKNNPKIAYVLLDKPTGTKRR